MADEGLRIVNTVDNTQVDAAFSNMRKQIINSAETAQQQGKKIDNAIDRVALSANATSETLKRKIYESSQVVNGLTAKIIEQKAVVKDIQADVKRLGEAYRQAKKNGSFSANQRLAELNRAKKSLDEERAALFELNQEKQRATLRTKELKGQYDLMKKATDDNVLSVGLLKGGLAALGGTVALKSFTQQILHTRGEFQQLEVAFKTMLGSAEKANALMSQLIRTAAVTPFDLKGVTDGAKQLLAYGIAAEDVNDTLIHLGDIAAGLSLPLGDLVYLYGTTMTQGRMFTQDLRQFMGRGIPLAEELAKQFGVTKDKVGELVTAGKVGAKEFNTAIMSMSSEGSKFGGLMEEQSKTISGQISNIEDAIEGAFNNLGKQSESAINTALSGVSFLVENYEKIGKVILSVVGVYGTYKAAVLAVIAVEKIMAAARLAQIKQTTLCQLATDVLTKKMALLNTTMLANPWVLAATAIAGCVAVIANLETRTERMIRVEEEYKNALNETIKMEEKRLNEANEYIEVASNEALAIGTRREAILRLIEKYPEIFEKYKTEAEWLEHIRDIQLEIAELEGKRSHSQATVQLDDVNARIALLEEKGSARFSSQSASAFVYTTQTGGRTSDEEAELQNLYKERMKLSEQIQKDKGKAYMLNLTGISNEELERQINKRKDLLAKMGLSKKDSAKLAIGDTIATYSRDEIKAQSELLEAERNRRNEKRYSPSEIKGNLKAELESARKALDDFEKSSTKYTIAEAEAERKRLQNAVTEAEKKYKDMGGDASTTKKAAQDNNKRLEELESKQSLARKRAQEDAAIETRQAMLDVQENSSEKILEQYQLDFEKQKLAIERGYEDLKQKKVDEARSLFEANPANKGKDFDSSKADISYTKEEMDRYAALLDANRKAYEQNVEKYREAENSALMQYLKEYGDYEQKKLAITQEYEKKIKDASFEGEKMSLQKELEKALKDLDFGEFKKNINWEAVFGDLGKYTKDQLNTIRKQLKAYKESDDYVKGTIENKKVIDEAINQISETIQDKSGIFGGLGEALNELSEAERELAEATEALNKAKTQTEKDSAKKKKDKAQTRVDNAEANVKSSAEKTRDSITSLASTITSLGTASELTLSDLGSLGNSIASMFGEIGKKVGGWIEAIFTLCDMVARDGLEGLINNVGKLVGQVLGGLFGIDIDKSQHEYEDQKKLHDNYIKLLQNLISKQEELLSKQAGLEAFDTYKQTEQYYQRIIDARLSDNKKYYNAGASKGFLGIGSSNSNGIALQKKWFDGIVLESFEDNEGRSFVITPGDQTEKERGLLKEYLGIFGKISPRLDELGNATVEQIKQLQQTAYLWSSLPDEVIDYYNEILAADEAMQKLRDTFNETITGTSFDSLLGSFESTLEKMDASANDWADNIQDIFNKAIVNSLVKDKYSKLLREWYGDAEKGTGFAGAMAQGVDKLSQAQIDSLRKDYMDIVNDAKSDADTLRQILEINDTSSFSQTASSKGFQTMDQDTGNELNGRFTALQIAAYDIKDLATARNEMLLRMEQNQGEVKTSVDGITDAIALTNIHLSDIAKYTKHLIAIEEVLGDIKDNTKHL